MLIDFKSVSLARQEICMAGFSGQRVLANATWRNKPMCLPENFLSCQTNELNVYQPLRIIIYCSWKDTIGLCIHEFVSVDIRKLVNSLYYCLY